MKLKPDAKAVHTLGPKMGHDKFKQAAARLRQLAKGQSLAIAAPGDICMSIEEVCGLAPGADIQAKHVLQWVLCNTAQAIEKAFPEYLSQALHFAHSVGKPIFVDKEEFTLQGLYGTRRTTSTKALISQALCKDEQNSVCLSERGACLLEVLQKEVNARGDMRLSNETGANEECQREVLLEMEEEKEAEEEEQAPRLEAVVEQTWNYPRAAMMLQTAADVAESQGIKVMNLQEASTYLTSEPDVARSIRQLHWASSIYVTQNFVSIAAGDGAMAVHVRSADNMLLFEDCSVLLISEREAEHILRAVRALPVDTLAACLVNLAMCRWSAPSPGGAWGRVPLALGKLPSTNAGNSLMLRSIVCVQLFNGETKFEPGSSMDEENSDRHAAVITTVFGQAEQRVAAEQGTEAAKHVVHLRGRGRCWQDSDLERICSGEGLRAQSSRMRGS